MQLTAEDQPLETSIKSDLEVCGLYSVNMLPKHDTSRDAAIE